MPDSTEDQVLSQCARAFQAAPQELQDRVVLVTGAGSGIGKAVAVAAARVGAAVVLSGRSIKRLEATYDEINSLGKTPASIAPLNLETALAPQYHELAQAVLQQYGRLDGLVHCAAQLGKLAPLAHSDVPTFYKVMHVNVTACFALTQVLLPLLDASSDGSVVFCSSGVGRRGRAFWGAYAASKFAIEGLAQVLADETRGTNLRANTINPGKARTAMRRAAYPSEDLNSLPEPATLTAPFLWLLSAASRGVTGRSLNAQ
jgi:NAD(P)-dependent dehydrogenase (short-subunit alcohol dehydrogenase family)